MFDFALFALLIAVSIPGIFLASCRQVETLRRRGARAQGPVPSRSTLVVVGMLQDPVLFAIAAVVSHMLFQLAWYPFDWHHAAK